MRFAPPKGSIQPLLCEVWLIHSLRLYLSTLCTVCFYEADNTGQLIRRQVAAQVCDMPSTRGTRGQAHHTGHVPAVGQVKVQLGRHFRVQEAHGQAWAGLQPSDMDQEPGLQVMGLRVRCTHRCRGSDADCSAWPSRVIWTAWGFSSCEEL